MATLKLYSDNSDPIEGLNTGTFTVVNPGYYSVQCKSTIQPGSGLQIVINKNGSAQVTNGSPSASQQSIAANAKFYCAAADVITIVLTSSSAVDAAPNAVKSIMNIYYGE